MATKTTCIAPDASVGISGVTRGSIGAGGGIGIAVVVLVFLAFFRFLLRPLESAAPPATATLQTATALAWGVAAAALLEFLSLGRSSGGVAAVCRCLADRLAEDPGARARVEGDGEDANASGAGRRRELASDERIRRHRFLLLFLCAGGFWFDAGDVGLRSLI